MVGAFSTDGAAWRQAEHAWTSWLAAQGYSVVPTAEREHNTSGTAAPMMYVNGQPRRVPDVLTTRLGTMEYWEVKYRTRADLDKLTGEREHWMAFDAFKDYYLVARQDGVRLWVVLYEAPTAVAPGRWLRIDVGSLRDIGARGRRFGSGGVEIDAWIWPVAAMKVINGPAAAEHSLASPLPEEGDQERLVDDDLEFVERRSRRPQPSVAETPEQVRAAAVLASSNEVGLDVLAASLSLPSRPYYSVLCVNPKNDELDDLLGLLDYGIRVFVVSEASEQPETDRLKAFADSRMLEWAKVVDRGLGGTTYVIDGRDDAGAASAALEAADAAGGINARQYRIVHQSVDDDVLVMSGAGTGKTETMAERFVFLLATSHLTPLKEGASPRPLRADEIALVTFTRDAAAEMRERLARTLMLRQRLAPRCALPALAWMMQLSGAQISTIHSFAKRMGQLGGGALGFNPGFAVSNRSIEFGALLERRLSRPLADLFSTGGDRQVPAAYEWEKHAKTVWEGLSNNGVDLLNFTGNADSRVDWGQGPAGQLEQAVVTATRDVVQAVSADFRADCVAAQAVPTSQLVPLALASLESVGPATAKTLPRFLFVDEFQDTDHLQMRLLLKVRELSDARLFLVGDAKQGVYRFRGAAGNAFELFRTLYEGRGLGRKVEHTLTRNFRSGKRLLDSLHPFFDRWGSSELLTYTTADRLLPRLYVSDDSEPIRFEPVQTRDVTTRAAQQVADWRRTHPTASIGVLCRRNRQALEIQKTLREVHRLPCEIRVGGSFFTSPAVREMRVLLDAATNPSDDAALLELCETRWAAGILGDASPHPALKDSWDGVKIPIRGLSARLASLAAEGSMLRDDLDPLRRRIVALRGLLDRSPTLAWIVDCVRMFDPQGCQKADEPDDETERNRYGRCLDQLITRLDSQFQDSPASPERILAWLRLQIATNRIEDEDMPPASESGEGKIVALTVHKAKGLEYDFVVVPHLETKFDPPRNITTDVAVLEGGTAGEARLAWRWRPNGSNDWRFTNVTRRDQRLWSQEASETAREETRLLYVALTRAKKRLMVLRPNVGRGGSEPNRWADLINMLGN